MAEITSVQGLIKHYYNVAAVNELSFEVRKGEVFELLGPNRAGKTTTLECLEGMRQADAGLLRLDGCDPKSDGQQLRQILGVQLQSSSLPDGIQPKDAMALICAWHGRLPRFDLLSRFGIDPQTNKTK